MKVCLKKATEFERFAEDIDVSGFVGTPVTFKGEVVGVTIKAWVENGSLYGDLDLRSDIAEAVVDRVRYDKID